MNTPVSGSRNILRTVLLVAALVVLSSCSWFGKQERQPIPVDHRPTLVVLPVRLDMTVEKASQVETIPENVSLEEDQQRAAEAAKAIRAEASRIFVETIETRGQFQLIPLEDVDAVVREIGFDTDQRMTSDQFILVQDRLQADLIVQPTVLDYGKLRWSWLAKGMLADTTWQTLLIKLAFASNPAMILGNVGLEAVGWLGGGYVFAVASKPVRVEGMAWEPVNGKTIWKEEEAALFVWRRLHELPKTERSKKEAQLYVNLQRAMKDLADSLSNKGMTISKRNVRHPRPVPDSQQTIHADCSDETVSVHNRAVARRAAEQGQEICEAFGL